MLSYDPADRIAQALVLGFGWCEEHDMPLGDLQQTHMLRATLLVYDGLEAETVKTLERDAEAARRAPETRQLEEAGRELVASREALVNVMDRAEALADSILKSLDGRPSLSVVDDVDDVDDEEDDDSA